MRRLRGRFQKSTGSLQASGDCKHYQSLTAILRATQTVRRQNESAEINCQTGSHQGQSLCCSGRFVRRWAKFGNDKQDRRLEWFESRCRLLHLEETVTE